MTITLDGQPIEIIKEFLQATPLASYTTATAVKDSLHLLIAALRYMCTFKSTLKNSPNMIRAYSINICIS